MCSFTDSFARYEAFGIGNTQLLEERTYKQVF